MTRTEVGEATTRCLGCRPSAYCVGETLRVPLRTLGGFRGWEGKAYFGQNVVFEEAGSFRVGETVRILEKGEARPPLARLERSDRGVPG